MTGLLEIHLFQACLLPLDRPYGTASHICHPCQSPARHCPKVRHATCQPPVVQATDRASPAPPRWHRSRLPLFLLPRFLEPPERPRAKAPPQSLQVVQLPILPTKPGHEKKIECVSWPLTSAPSFGKTPILPAQESRAERVKPRIELVAALFNPVIPIPAQSISPNYVAVPSSQTTLRHSSVKVSPELPNDLHEHLSVIVPCYSQSRDHQLVTGHFLFLARPAMG